MVAKLSILTHKIAIQLHLVAESSTICSSRSRRPVRKLLDTASYLPHTEDTIVKHRRIRNVINPFQAHFLSEKPRLFQKFSYQLSAEKPQIDRS